MQWWSSELPLAMVAVMQLPRLLLVLLLLLLMSLLLRQPRDVQEERALRRKPGHLERCRPELRRPCLPQRHGHGWPPPPSAVHAVKRLVASRRCLLRRLQRGRGVLRRSGERGPTSQRLSRRLSGR